MKKPSFLTAVEARDKRLHKKALQVVKSLKGFPVHEALDLLNIAKGEIESISRQTTLP